MSFSLYKQVCQRFLRTTTFCQTRWLSSQLEVSTKNFVQRVTLASPKTRNALSLELLKELEESFSAIPSDLRCIILSAQGNVFSSGHNLKELTGERGKDYHLEVFESCSRLMRMIPSLPVPVIAQVDGVAAAAGCQLVLSCDIVVASDVSSFVTPGASVGIFCSTPGVALVRNAPRKISADMLLTGLPLDARRALEVGLVSAVVPRERLEAEVERRVDAILQKSRSVIALGKRFLYRQMEMGIARAYEEGSQIMVDNINMEDGQEGIRSFVQKRKPKWSHAE